MKVAVIADIHGNHYALSEVLKVARQEKAEKLLVLGDICGYYYHPDKVLQLIEDWDFRLIRGNHERLLLDLKMEKIIETELRKQYGSGHRFAIEKLSEEEIYRICLAPDQLQVEFDNVSILMCHGSPVDSDQYLYPDSEKVVLEGCDVENIDFVLVGHSHYPFTVRNKFSTLINVGSVGQSRRVGGIASWLMLNTANNSFEAKATPYRTEQLEKEVVIIDPEIHYLLDILKRNRK